MSLHRRCIEFHHNMPSLDMHMSNIRTIPLACVNSLVIDPSALFLWIQSVQVVTETSWLFLGALLSREGKIFLLKYSSFASRSVRPIEYQSNEEICNIQVHSQLKLIIIIQKTSLAPKSSDNPNSVAHQKKIICLSQIRL